MNTFTLLTASSDDAYQTAVGQATILNDTNHNPGPTEIFTGLRFDNIAIQPDTLINSARLHLWMQTSKNGLWDTTIYCEAADDATTFTTGVNDISNRTLTTAGVYWNNTGESGFIYPRAAISPDLSLCVQEVVNRAGWASGNAINFIMHSPGGSATARFEGYDSGVAVAPKLAIDAYLPVHGRFQGGGGVSVSDNWGTK